MSSIIKDMVREKLNINRIILFGAGVVAEEFYERNRMRLNIVRCVSNIQREWGNVVLGEELVVQQFRVEDLTKDDYIVVCGPIAFRTIELQLQEEGMNMYNDYIESHIAEAILESKKIALFYGQCVLRDIYNCIIQVPAFRNEYTPIFTQAATGQAIVTNRLLYYAKDLCDLYVYAPKILDFDSIYFLSPKELPPECKIVSVSNLMVSFYWPQIDARLKEYNEFYIHPYGVKRDLDFYHTIYRRADKNINQMVLEGKTAKEITAILSRPDFYEDKFVNRYFKIAMKQIDIAENTVDVKIGDFIRSKYREKKIYQNFLHPNKCVVWEYTRRLLEKIHIDTNETFRLEEESPEHIHQGGDVPIYPCVAEILQLDFIDVSTQYEILTGRGIVYMTFDEYIEHKVAYTQKAIDIMRMW